MINRRTIIIMLLLFAVLVLNIPHAYAAFDQNSQTQAIGNMTEKDYMLAKKIAMFSISGILFFITGVCVVMLATKEDN